MRIAAVAAVIAVVASLAALWAAGTRNRLAALSGKRDEFWNAVLAQLQRRRDLALRLAKAGECAEDKTGALREAAAMAAAPVSGGPSEVLEPEREFSRRLIRALATAERHSGLKADRRFQELQNELVGIEEDIRKARRRYNDSAAEFSKAAAAFPGRLMLKRCGFFDMPPFDLESPTEAETPTVSFSVRD